MQREFVDWLRVKELPEQLAEIPVCAHLPRHESLLASLNETTRMALQLQINRLFHWSLDQCYGECLLRQPALARIVAESILHDEGIKFDIDRFVVMPNHVHVLAQFRPGFDLSVVGQSWLRFSARKIHRILGRSGAFWQPEPFDHAIRSDEQFRYLQKYIADNPVKANLGPDEYFFWSR